VRAGGRGVPGRAGSTGRLAAVFGATLFAAGCYIDPAASPSIEPAPTPAGQPASPPPEGSLEAVIVAPHEAEARGYAWQSTLLQFGDEPDGTKLLMELLARAKAKGAAYVSDVRFHFVTAKGGKPVECEITIQPEDVPAPVVVPEKVERVQAMVPVQRTVTEHEYKCTPVMRPNTHYVTEMQNQCASEMVPVTRTETTYVTQYDYTSKSSRSVPQTRTVTSYESRYSCRPQSVGRMVTDYRTEQDCHTEPVTRSVTRYEFQLQTHFVPPHLEYVQKRKLSESEPVCYLVAGEAPAQGGRLEAKLYFPKQAAGAR
jgi:hypothetical protein